MGDISDILIAILVVICRVAGVTALIFLVLALVFGFLFLTHFCLSLPLRRAERARLFLDLLESTLQQGLAMEETLISLSQSRDQSMGVKFHLLAAWLETGLSLEAALARVPDFLPPQVTAMLRAGRQLRSLSQVLPACRHVLKDSSSQTQGAFHYLIILTFVITPVGFFIFGMFMVFIIPKYLEVFASTGMHTVPSGMLFLGLLHRHFDMVMVLQFSALFLLWLAVFIYLGGPRVTAWWPVLERVHFWLPWRRRRMQRDFSSLLAVLLDAGVPEAEALKLAGEGAANSVFRDRTARAVADLSRGLSLPEAVQQLDDSGEFRWRLRNAVAGHGGFLQALAGWHESLDARAFQLEQAAAHGVTTALVVFSGLFVGAIAISVFMFFVASINQGVLW